MIEEETNKNTKRLGDRDEALKSHAENSEDNPLSAWLTKSALPSVMPLQTHPLDQTKLSELGPLKEEIKEIEAFRHVHVALGSKVENPETPKANLDETPRTELPTQIFHRNIRDRYPGLPIYLVRRLAEANSDRAKRLSQKRAKAENEPTKPAKKKAPHRYTTNMHYASVPYHQYSGAQYQTKPIMKKAGRASPTYYVNEDRSPAFKSPKSKKGQSYSYASYGEAQSTADYWSGGRPQRRTRSTGSRSSSMNSSLHGSPKFYRQKQYQNIDFYTSEPDSHYHTSSLPPPPKKINSSRTSRRKANDQVMKCDICGEVIKVAERTWRRQWQ